MKKMIFWFVGWIAVSVIADPLPLGWFDQPFGTYTDGYEGETFYQDGVFDVTASGANMGGLDEDGGRFVFQPVRGDFDLIVEVERLPWAAEGLSAWPRAGVMVRSSSDRDSAALAMSRRRGASEAENASTFRVERRAARAEIYAATGNYAMTADWLRFRMVRRGSAVQLYASTESSPDTWTGYGTSTVALNDSVLAGFYLCKTSSSAADTVTSRFRNPVLRELVSVQKEANSNLVSWVADLPGIETAYNYEVKRRVDGSAFASVAKNLTIASYTDTNITPGWFYEYKVLANNGSVTIGNSAKIYAGADRPGQSNALTNGLHTAYYTPAAATNLPVTLRLDPGVGENWTNAVAGLDENDFRMVMTGTIRPETNGLYFFTTGVNKYLSLVVDGVPLMAADAVSSHPQCSSSAPIWLEGGRSYSLVAEYVHSDASAQVLDLQWARQGDAAPAPLSSDVWEPSLPGWLTRDVGFPEGGATSCGVTTDLVTLAVTGGSVSNTEDAVRFLYKKTEREFDFAARLQPSSAGAVRAVSGLMVRGGVDGCDVQVSLFTRPAADDTLELVMASRSCIRQIATLQVLETGIPASDPVSLRVKRQGMETTFYRLNNEAWEMLTSVTAGLPPDLHVGVFAAGVDSSTVCAVAVDQFVWKEASAFSVRYPTDDTYVQSGSANSTFYNSHTLVCGRSREILMKFDVADLSKVSRAVLRLFVSQYDDNQNQPVYIRTLTTTSWSEKNLTANTAPEGIMPPSPWVPTNDPSVVAFAQVPKLGNWLEVDVTAAVREHALRSGKLALHIYTPSTVGWVLCFPSSNGADASLRPHLACVYGAPVGVQAATGPLEQAVALSWLPLADAVSYRVERAFSPEGPFEEVASGLTVTQFIETNLTAYVRRYYRVMAMTSEGATDYSETVSAVPRLFTSLLPEADVFVEGGASKDLNLDYSSNQTRGQYLVAKYTGDDSGGARESFIRFNLAGYSRVITRALLRLSVETSSVLGPVLDIKAITNSVWNEAATTWNNPPGGVALPSIWTTTVPANTVRVTMTAPGTVTEADITALAQTASEISDKLSLQIYQNKNLNAVFYTKEYAGDDSKRPRLYVLRSDPGTPTVVAEDGSLVISWSPYPGATAYHVERADSLTGPFVRVAQNMTGTTYRDATVPNGSIYHYRIVAVTPEEDAVSAPTAYEWFAYETRYPVADTFLDQNNPTVNFGSSAQLLAKAGIVRESFFKYDVSGLENVASARFSIRCQIGAGFALARIAVFAGMNGDWSANSVTWSKPIPGITVPRVITGTVADDEVGRVVYGYNTANRIEVDATEAVRAAAIAGQPLTFRVCTDNVSTHYVIDSSEATASGTMKPSLIVPQASFCQKITAESMVDVPATNAVGLSLSWSPVGGIATYSVSRLNPKTGDWTLLASGLTAPSFMDDTVYPDVEYTYQVTALLSSGESYNHAFTAMMGRTFSRYADADTFVFSASKTSSYGTNPIMVLKCGGSGSTREAFLRFDLRDLPVGIRNASLRITVSGLEQFTPDDVLVFEVFPDFDWVNNPAPNWNEFLGLQTGNTPLPAPGTNPNEIRRYSDIQFAAGESLAMDITSNIVAAQAAGASFITLHVYLYDSNNAANMGFFTIEGGPLFSMMPQITYSVADWSGKGTLLILR